MGFSTLSLCAKKLPGLCNYMIMKKNNALENICKMPIMGRHIRYFESNYEGVNSRFTV